jgi:hypothetical protein
VAEEIWSLGRSFVRTILTAVCLLLALPAAANAASPWQSFRAAPFDLPAGSRCPFELTGDIVKDQERIRAVEPGRSEVKGLLVVRYTNVATGASVVRNLNGDALIDQRADGSISRITLVHGHLSVGLGASDPAGPAFLVLHGRDFVVDFAPDGTRTITFGTGDVENICQTLG